MPRVVWLHSVVLQPTSSGPSQPVYESAVLWSLHVGRCSVFNHTYLCLRLCVFDDVRDKCRLTRSHAVCVDWRHVCGTLNITRMPCIFSERTCWPTGVLFILSGVSEMRIYQLLSVCDSCVDGLQLTTSVALHHLSALFHTVISTRFMCVLSPGSTICVLHRRHRTTPASSHCNLATDRSVHGVTHNIVCVLRLANVPSLSPCRELFPTCPNAFTCIVRTMYPFVQFCGVQLVVHCICAFDPHVTANDAM